MSAIASAGRDTSGYFFGVSFFRVSGVSWSSGLIMSRSTLLATCA
jgi:hypothetical protein